jgi:hypothetical protein
MNGAVRRSRLRYRLLVLLGLVGTATMLGSDAWGRSQQAGPRSQPDFTVLSVKIRSLNGRPFHIFHGRARDGFIVEIVVKNVGDAPRAGAGKLSIHGNGELRPEKLVFDVPRLRPGRKREIDVSVDNRDLGGMNSYTTRACASTRRDTRHRNDCRRGPDFAVIARRWVGSTHSKRTSAVIEEYGGDVTYTFDEGKSQKQNKFVYTGTGSWTVTITGDTDPDCTYSGSATRAINPPTTSLVLERKLFEYRAVGRVAPGESYTAQASCFGGPSGPVELDAGLGWFDSPITRMEPSDERLAGSEGEGADSSDRWSFAAE